MSVPLRGNHPMGMKRAYLDYQSTTPLDDQVLGAMMPYLTGKFGNPHSAEHNFGWEAEAALDVSREQVAAVINGQPEGVTLLSGATEANNLALKGVMEMRGQQRPHLVTVATEHKCILEAAHYCKLKGYQLTVLPVDQGGILDLNQLEDALTDETALVSVMAVNNEIGVIQPLKEIGALCRSKGVLFHTDAAQAFGKIPLDVIAMNIDLMSISGHKIYGPKGVGALYHRPGKDVTIAPQMHGGGQEGGLRAGTQAPALVAGLGKAASLCAADMAQEAGRINGLMTRFKRGLSAFAPAMRINGDELNRWAGNLNICFPGLDGNRLFADIRGLAVSSGAACASAVAEPSYVLAAIGVTQKDAKASLRIGIGRMTTDEEIDFAIAKIGQAVRNQGGCE